MVIPTTIPLEEFNYNDIGALKGQDASFQKEKLLDGLGLGALISEIYISSSSTPSTSIDVAFNSRNTVIKSLYEAFNTLPESLLAALDLTPASLASSFPESYSVYKPLLLLPSHAFSAPSWVRLLSAHPVDSPTLASIWKHVANSVGATHVAMNAGIPLKTPPTTLPQPSNHETEAERDVQSAENILRSPANLTPIHGTFGPPPTPQTLSSPTAADFEAALWVSTTQNNIHQVWAPLYTMFSRGNIREKTRLLTHPSVQTSISEGKSKLATFVDSDGSGPRATGAGQGSTAVDLYAGIGYFAFPYARAGISKVLCWELNPWSIEGLVRGAKRNGWSTKTFTTFPTGIAEWREWATAVPDVDILVFQQSNEHALNAILQLAWEGPRDGKGMGGRRIPPVRHVNCGFLPSSRQSWDTAVKIVDSRLGGWMHLHENVGVDGIEARKEEIEIELQSVLDRWEGEKGACGSYRKRVRCEHVERVKTYAPGVVHVVFDVWVDGQRDAEFLL
ncbi:hypothetical protein K505DRAFT_305487 [Melanomma pulvis-pyrius CBS 109.77]|uniref:tRNA wybutosine-synthesizing protein 2 n=1 Tax=Melanomma pulvis-pyrius CBS 109.77 TaxID=1314802 RepID=A0A6A6XAR9_9PLEO|nr:hypothetical protein K505DRAFT_305487 [Melanomma pulvis-pyrius CBS 109.77]